MDKINSVKVKLSFDLAGGNEPSVCLPELKVPEDSQQEAGYWKIVSGFFYEVRQTAHFAYRYKILGERFISHGNIPGSFPKNPSHAAADTGFSDRRRW